MVSQLLAGHVQKVKMRLQREIKKVARHMQMSAYDAQQPEGVALARRGLRQCALPGQRSWTVGERLDRKELYQSVGPLDE